MRSIKPQKTLTGAVMQVNQFGVSVVCGKCIDAGKLKGCSLIGGYRAWHDWTCDCCGFVQQFEDAHTFQTVPARRSRYGRECQKARRLERQAAGNHERRA